MSGTYVVKTVLRSDPAGVDLMRSYPDFNDDPGVEPWLKPEQWSADKVFDSMKRWSFAQSEGTEQHTVWEGMQQWHHSHPLLRSIFHSSSHSYSACFDDTVDAVSDCLYVQWPRHPEFIAA